LIAPAARRERSFSDLRWRAAEPIGTDHLRRLPELLRLPLFVNRTGRLIIPPRVADWLEEGHHSSGAPGSAAARGLAREPARSAGSEYAI
jgi:hypothetical protein